MSLPYRVLVFRSLLACFVLQSILLYAAWDRIIVDSSVADTNLVDNRADVVAQRALTDGSLQILEQNSLSKNVQEFDEASYGVDDFVYKNRKWGGACPEIKYKININTGQVDDGNGTKEEFRQAIISAAQTWNAVGGADFALTYDGETDATTTGYNGSNEIIFSHEGREKPSGLARIWFTSDFTILEADIWINSDYKWDVTGSPATDELDLQSVMLHEFGHWLALGHDDTHDAVMFATVTLGSVKRELHPHEVEGISFIYPRNAGSSCAQGEVPAPTPTPLPTNTPVDTPTVLPTATPVDSATPAPILTFTPTSLPSNTTTTIPEVTATFATLPTSPVDSASTPMATPSPTAVSSDLQANYTSGAPGSFFTIRGNSDSANQKLDFTVQNPQGKTVQDTVIQANENSGFSLMIDTSGAPAGRYTIEIAAQSPSAFAASSPLRLASERKLAIVLDSTEPLRAQEPPIRSDGVSVFELPLIDDPLILYLPFVY